MFFSLEGKLGRNKYRDVPSFEKRVPERNVMTAGERSEGIGCCGCCAFWGTASQNDFVSGVPQASVSLKEVEETAVAKELFF